MTWNGDMRPLPTLIAEAIGAAQRGASASTLHLLNASLLEERLPRLEGTARARALATIRHLRARAHAPAQEAAP